MLWIQALMKKFDLFLATRSLAKSNSSLLTSFYRRKMLMNHEQLNKIMFLGTFLSSLFLGGSSKVTGHWPQIQQQATSYQVPAKPKMQLQSGRAAYRPNTLLHNPHNRQSIFDSEMIGVFTVLNLGGVAPACWRWQLALNKYAIITYSHSINFQQSFNYLSIIKMRQIYDIDYCVTHTHTHNEDEDDNNNFIFFSTQESCVDRIYELCHTYAWVEPKNNIFCWSVCSGFSSKTNVYVCGIWRTPQCNRRIRMQ